jgi:hypothetical protein
MRLDERAKIAILQSVFELFANDSRTRIRLGRGRLRVERAGDETAKGLDRFFVACGLVSLHRFPLSKEKAPCIDRGHVAVQSIRFL